MAKDALHPVGEVDGKEYFLDLRRTMEDDKGRKVPNPNYEKLVWRVPDIREAVIAEPGYLILSADYSQIEVKLMAHLSRDPVLIAAINSGKDIHSFNAVEVFGAKLNFDYDIISSAKSDKTHPRHAELVKLRNDIKTTTFGVPYGAGAKRIAGMTGMTEEAAQGFIDEFFSKFSVLHQWIIASGDHACKYGFSLSPRGRRRFYDLPGPDMKEKEKDKILSQVRRYAGNQPIQSGNVDMLKPAMACIYCDLREHHREDGSRILFCVHDEIVLTTPDHLGLRTDESGRIVTLDEMDAMKKAKQKTLPGPIESIMMKRMQESYDSIIPDIVNRIDVAIGRVWEKA